MKSPKSITIIFILALGILGSVYILKDNFSSKNNPPSSSEKLSVFDKVGNLFNFGGSQDLPSSLEQAVAKSSDNNLTNALGAALAFQIKAKNSPDKALIEPDQNLPSDSVIENIIKGSLTNSKEYHPKVYTAKYFVSDDVSQGNQIKYVKELESILKNDLGDFRASSNDVMKQIADQQKGDLAQQAANVYGEIADDYSRITVPKNWVDFHKILLSHFYSAQDVYTALADFDNDPMKSYVAVQAVPKIDQSANGISTLISKKMKENNLQF